MSTSYDPDRLTKTDLDHELWMLEHRFKMKLFNLAMSGFLVAVSIAGVVMFILALAIDKRCGR